jgi:plastocyanin domain-containing protein
MIKKSNRTAIKVIIPFAVVLVVALGVFTQRQNLGISLPWFSDTMQYAQVKGNVQTVSIDAEPKKYTPIEVQRGIPVHFIVKADSSIINSCASTLIIPKYGIEKALKPGENIIEFTPQETGTIPYSCKMEMVKSEIKVVDKIENK